MKIAFYNIENLFHRDSGLVKRTLSESVKAWMDELQNLMCKDSRAENDFTRMRELTFLLGFHSSALEPYVVMRRKAGNLYMRKRDAAKEYKATELSNWNGWVKLNSSPINEAAVRNKARLIYEVGPDILILQEVEDRQSLVEFNEHYLPEEVRFSEIFVIPGNDPENRDLAILTRKGFKVDSIQSYANTSGIEGGKLFDKDLHKYRIKNPKGDDIWILSAHLTDTEVEKAISDDRRKEQATKIAEVYNELREKGHRKVIVAGTLNAVSYCDSLSPLLRETDLQDIKKHTSFNVDVDTGKDADYYSLGAYRMGVNIKQKDYFLLSPQLLKEMNRGGLNRKAVWPLNKEQWRVFKTLQCEVQQASSHPVLWARIDNEN
ncbi:hypothetical protein ACXYMT_11625 [Salinimicrobium sp. CAU 1759]|jgi:endonuclease/exonuclease/phosphatase family metal-dependent hydrolase